MGPLLLIEPEGRGKRNYPPSTLARYFQKRYKRKKILRHAANEGCAVVRLE